MQVRLKNERTGQYKQTKLGFSWTMLFFGVFTPLVRGNWKWFFASLLLAMFTAGLSWLVLPFLYNKIYINQLLSEGYVPADEMSTYALRTKGVIF